MLRRVRSLAPWYSAICGSAIGPLMFVATPHAPLHLLSAGRPLEIGEFQYVPELGVNPNEVRTRGGGVVKLNRPVSAIVRGKVASSIKEAKLKETSRALILTGNIVTLQFDELPLADSWFLHIHYILTDKVGGTVVYEGGTSTRQSIAKGLRPENWVEIAAGFNVLDLLKDPAFRQALTGEP